MGDITLAKALLSFQADAPPVHLDATNPHFRNKYASLGGVVAAIRPALNRNGLVYSQLPTNIQGQPALRTVLMHADSGESLEDTMPLILPKNDPQGQGSALTYARRYALLSILGLVGDEDDDATAATPTTAKDTPRENPFQAPEQAADPHGLQSSRADAPQDGGSPSAVILTFGKHKGSPIRDVPRAYLEWLIEQGAPKTADMRRQVEAARIFLGGVEQAPIADEDIPFMWQDGQNRELGVWCDPWRRG